MFETIGTLIMLVFLQIVLGFDNLLYISIESKRVAEDQQKRVRQIGIIIAIALRIILLFIIFYAIQMLEEAFFEINWAGVIEAKKACFENNHGHFELLKDVSVADCQTTAAEGEEAKQVIHGGVSGHFIIVLGGGAFILYTAVKEIMHMMSFDQDKGNQEDKAERSPNEAIFWIVLMNLVFSFDSILGAMALTKNLWIMGFAIVVSGVLMIVLADTVSTFLAKNRMYEVLGLFILFLVGVMLVTEAGHLANLKLMGSEIHAMNKSTFYFVLVVLVLVDVAQSRYQRKLNMELENQNTGS